ncbi:uncharacterized protein B0J16DRAFT_375054 [Fusarium flagelliforme]|uniref:uncharacterized protein n=1 Tax=Fusarium flagelliforme TaxID=2675880 RepID=UPI001E8D2E3F|nr:uncharacterized protein B0J16DRAFT_375054 [Fusarium flagelliforme]KAH7174128.1 hypothetical protein B0J16DRAFT_375054 [Fusarium flagelliforme]
MVNGKLTTIFTPSNQPRASQCPLLQLPSEILAKIVDELHDDFDSLKKLALVNSDCFKLARARQYAEFHFDFSGQKIAFLKHLFNTALEIATCDTGRRFITSQCVRRCNYSVDELWATDLFPISSLFGVRLMTNLETLVWDDPVLMNQATFTKLCTQTAAHTLKLSGIVLDGEWPLDPTVTRLRSPIHSLDINVLVVVPHGENRNLVLEGTMPNQENNIFESIFKLCGPTLESLTWHYQPNRARKPLSIDLDKDFFPVSVIFDSRIVGELMTSDSELLFKREPYRDLENLGLNHVNDYEAVTDFILNHNQIQKLYLTQGRSKETTDFDRLLLGMGAFSNLRSLLVIWNQYGSSSNFDFKVSHSALRAISEMKGLDQLTLGCFTGPYAILDYETYYDENPENHLPQWNVDHDMLRTHLSGLKNLKKLAFHGDTYKPTNKHPHHMFYYTRPIAPDDDWADVRSATQPGSDYLDVVESDAYKSVPSVQERTRLLRMVKHANAWSQDLPHLEWIVCGQRPMEFILNDEGLRKASPLGKLKDECRTYIQ